MFTMSNNQGECNSSPFNSNNMKSTKALKQTVSVCMLIFKFLKDDADISISVKGKGYAHDLINTPEGFLEGHWEDVDLGL